MKKLVDKLRGGNKFHKNLFQESEGAYDLARRTLKDRELNKNQFIQAPQEGNYENFRQIQTRPQNKTAPKTGNSNRFLLPKKAAIGMLIPIWSAMMPHYAGTNSSSNNEITDNKIEKVAEYKENSILNKFLNPESELSIDMPYWTKPGRFQNVYKYDEKFDKIEENHGLPQGLLKGIAMQESYGIELALNGSNDGGAGMFQFQPGTARAYGLDVRGKSKKTGVDWDHGREIANFVKNSEYQEVINSDERFNAVKSARAAADFLEDLKDREGTWAEAIYSYKNGHHNDYKDPKPSESPYVNKVLEFKEFYNSYDKD